MEYGPKANVTEYLLNYNKVWAIELNFMWSNQMVGGTLQTYKHKHSPQST